MNTDLVIDKVSGMLPPEDRMNLKFVNRQTHALLEHERHHLTNYQSDAHAQRWMDEVGDFADYDTFARYWEAMAPEYRAYVVAHATSGHLKRLLYAREHCVKIDGCWYYRETEGERDRQERLATLMADARLRKRLLRFALDTHEYEVSKRHEDACYEPDDYDAYCVERLMR